MPVVVKSNSAEPAPIATPAASKVAAPVTSISKIPASMSTIEPAFAFASIWSATPAVWAVTTDISLAAPVVVIFNAPPASIEVAPVTSMSKIPASISTIEPAFASPSKCIACPAVWAETKLICPSADVVVTTISSAASIVIASSTSISKIPASISNIEPAFAFASMCTACPAVWAETKLSKPFALVVVNEMSSAASIVTLSAESISILPALVSILIASAPVPDETITTLESVAPVTAIVKSCASPSDATIRLAATAAESNEIPAPSIAIVEAPSRVKTPEALRSIIAASTWISVEAFMSTVGAVISKVVPALISKWPSEDATMFSPPAASWNDNLVSPTNANSSSDWSHNTNCPEVFPNNFTSTPVPSTPNVVVPSIWTAPSISTASKLLVPFTSMSPSKSISPPIVAFPPMVNVEAAEPL